MPRKPKAQLDPDVTALLAKLRHPLAGEYDAVRRTILGVSAEIAEGVKWNSASYRTGDWFATINWRRRDAVQLVFHQGAKVKDGAAQASLQDPDGLVEWVSPNRCLVTLGAGKEVAANRAAFEAIVRHWIRQL